MSTRRQFIAGLGAAAVWPLAARAQQAALPVVGLLMTSPPDSTRDLMAAFHQGLAEVGYVEGRNVAIEYRSAEGKPERLPELAADLVRHRVAVIATPGGILGALAAKGATTAIPIVFYGGDPVGLGLVASLARPGANVTGFNEMNPELMAKKFGLLHELVPGAARVALIGNPTNPNNASMSRDARTAAATIGLQVEVLTASAADDIDAAFASFPQKRIGALVVAQSPLFYSLRLRFAALTARQAVPAIYWDRAFPDAGGLMSYGSSQTDLARLVGVYTGRILNGEKPAAAGPATDQIRAGDQPQDRQGLGPDGAADHARHCRRGDRVRRRTFITGLGAAAAWPLAARAEQAMPAVGWLSGRTSEADASVLPAFRRGLHDQGFDEGRNVLIEYRWANTQLDQLPLLAVELVQHQASVIVLVGATESKALEAIQATGTATSVIGVFSNLLMAGAVSRLNRPGGMVTGVNVLLSELGAKRLGLLHELLPSAATVAVLTRSVSSYSEAADVQQAARAIGTQVNIVSADSDREIEVALDTLAGMHPDALLVTTAPLFFSRARQIVGAMERLAIPTVYFRREFVDAGGLMSYGSNTDDNFRVAGDYAGRIIKGAKAGDLPIQQATKFELVINLKTAKTLGLTVPNSLLAIADEVIE